jgi:uncharacterized protein YecE (DUF72 family)
MVQPLRTSGKLRAIHFQFPPWFTATAGNRAYLATLHIHFPDDRIAIEFRHRSWLTPEEAPRTLAQLRDEQLAYVIADEPQIGSGSVPPLVAITSPELAILRLHGRNAKTWYIRDAASTGERFDYLYSRQELGEWVPQLRDLAERVAEVHVLTNNNRSNYAVVNAFDLIELLGLPQRSTIPEVIQEAMALREAQEHQLPPS